MDKLYTNKGWLGIQYLGLRKSTYKIARECGCDQVTVLNWLKKFDVNTRSYSEAKLGCKAWNKDLTKETNERVRKKSEALEGHAAWNKDLTKETDGRVRRAGEKLKGKNNGSWKGGTSSEPYPFDFNKELKELIRKRDGYICQLCHIPQRELLYKLSVHHIDYSKENLDPRNLVSLCKSCNSEVNFKREYWTKYFIQKISK